MTEHETRAGGGLPLTPREDRLVAGIARVLREGGTRSELRALVYAYADMARAQGIALEGVTGELLSMVSRASSTPTLGAAAAVGDSPADRGALVSRWCATRYLRAD
jgi:hypothetical protein